MPNQLLIKNKILALTHMVNALSKNEKVLVRIGGATQMHLGEEINFQEGRIANLQWANEATDEDIKQTIVDIESKVGTDIANCKYGNVRGLTFEQVEAIAHIEDLEIALGIHPAVKEVVE